MTPDIPIERQAVAIVELSEISRTLKPEGGDEGINRTLANFALSCDKLHLGVARLAVRELRSTSAFNDILTVMEKSGIIELAEEGMEMMCELRRLPMVENIVQRRPLLTMSYHKQLKYMNTVQELVSAAWGCSSEDTARIYLERLSEMRAVPELEQLGKKHKHISDLANKTLTSLRMQETTTRRL